MEEARRRLGDSIEYCEDKYEALIDADGLVVVTEWPEFRVLNYRVLDKLMREKVIFDGRNIYDPEELRNMVLPITASEDNLLTRMILHKHMHEKNINYRRSRIYRISPL